MGGEVLFMKNKKYSLTNKEYEIMKVLWGSDRPLLISDILVKVTNIASNSLHPMIKKLINDGFIEVVGNMRVVKTKSRLYTPAVTVDEYAAMQLAGIAKVTGIELNYKSVLSYVIKQSKNNNEDIINEIEEFIKEYRGENN